MIIFIKIFIRRLAQNPYRAAGLAGSRKMTKCSNDTFIVISLLSVLVLGAILSEGTLVGGFVIYELYQNFRQDTLLVLGCYRIGFRPEGILRNFITRSLRGLGGYMIGMCLMYERTQDIVIPTRRIMLYRATPEEIKDAIGTQIFGVVGGSDVPVIWYFADSLWFQLALVIIIPGSLALIFGWLAFRKRLSIDLNTGHDLRPGALRRQNDRPTRK